MLLVNEERSRMMRYPLADEIVTKGLKKGEFGREKSYQLAYPGSKLVGHWAIQFMVTTKYE